MKKNAVQSTKVYSNPDYENIVRSKLESSRKALQALAETWQGLNIGPCGNINTLLMRPETVYKTAIDKLVELPATGGRFTLKRASYMESLALPDPSELYSLAKQIRQTEFCAVSELWDLKGNEVVINEEVADSYIDAMSVYAVGSEKIALANDITKLCELLNSINRRVNGELIEGSPWTYSFFRNKFNVSQKFNGGLHEVEINIEKLKYWLSIV